jgi:hypothetical protein
MRSQGCPEAGVGITHFVFGRRGSTVSGRQRKSWVTSPTCLPSASRMERENVFSVVATSRPAFAQNAAMFLMVFA